VATSTDGYLTWLTEARDVVVLSWPGETAEAARLDEQGVPHLLLVEEGHEAPICESCFEDWITLPADEVHIRARMIGLARRAAHHSPRPSVDALGHLSHRGRSVFLSPIDQRLASALIERFGEVVTETDLLTAVWPEGASNQALRVHVSRLRQRIVPVGLKITCVRSSGYVMTDSTDNHSPVGDSSAPTS
jgi:DNA-binding response OmpR family regulator